MNELKLVYVVFLPLGGFHHEQLVSKRSELGRATARSSGIVPKGPS
jgi:hypothetical protein